jgi:hypothetical protein
MALSVAGALRSLAASSIGFVGVEHPALTKPISQSALEPITPRRVFIVRCDGFTDRARVETPRYPSSPWPCYQLIIQ